MENEGNKKTFFDKIVELQRMMMIEKSQDGYKFKYRNKDDILFVLKPAIAEMRLFLRFEHELLENGGRYFINCKAILSDGTNEISSKVFVELEQNKSQSLAQNSGSTITYAERYALNALLAVSDCEKDPEILGFEEQTKKQELKKNDLPVQNNHRNPVMGMGSPWKQKADPEKTSDMPELTEMNIKKYLNSFKIRYLDQKQEISEAHKNILQLIHICLPQHEKRDNNGNWREDLIDCLQFYHLNF